jgi:hypothetical protein
MHMSRAGAFGHTALFISALLFAIPAGHTAALPGIPAQTERLTYNIMVGGLNLGSALIVLQQSESGYTTEMKMTANGVAKMVRNFRSDMRGEGRFVDGFKPQPATYIRQWATDEVAANMTMTFDPTTRVAKTEERYFHPTTAAPIAREDLPWNRDDRDDERERPEAPEDLRTNAFDPMAAFIAARGQMMAQGVGGGKPHTFRLPVYDGRRRYDIVGRSEAPRTVTINGQEHSVIPVVAKLEPLFGFGRRSQARMKDSEGKLLFTNDARFIPVQVTISNEILSGVMNLTAYCSQNPAPCDNFGKAAE